MSKFRFLFVVACSLLLYSCKNAAIEGKVLDGFGKPVKDALVKVQGSEFSAKTDSKGEYSVDYVPGEIRVIISKDGFTDTAFSLNIATESTYPAQTVVIYEIPKNEGIFLIHQGKYVPLHMGQINTSVRTGRDYWGSVTNKYYTVDFDENALTSVNPADSLIFLDNDPINQSILKINSTHDGIDNVILKRSSSSGDFGIALGDYSDHASVQPETYKELKKNIFLRYAKLSEGIYIFSNYRKGAINDLGGNNYIIKVSSGQNALEQKKSESSSQEKDPAATPVTAHTVVNDIPTPTAPIVKAADVLPTWTSKENISGNYPMLSGLYVGAIGHKPIKIIIESVDTVKKTISGYSVVGNNQSAFTGNYTLNIRHPKPNSASNVIDVITYEFKVVLYESKGINKNGVFQLQFDNTDAQGNRATGTWVSYDGTLYREIRVFDTVTAQDQ